MREKLLIFGSNFSLAARIADVAQRDFEVIRFEFSACIKSGRPEVCTAFGSDLLSDAVSLNRARYVVLTSESMLYIDSKSLFDGLLDELRTCKQLAGICLAFVDIAEPIIVGPSNSIQVLNASSAYGLRMTHVRKALVDVIDLNVSVQSVYSPETDVWSRNFLHLLFESAEGNPPEVSEYNGEWEAISADQVSGSLISRMGFSGTIRLSNGSYPGGLKAFCRAVTTEYRDWLSSQCSTREKQGHPNPISDLSNVKPIHLGLHTVTRQMHCSVTYLYRKEPDAPLGTATVGHFRRKLGESLARRIPSEVMDEVDMILPVPETGKAYAQGLANKLQLPYVEGIFKGNSKRSFDIQSFDKRRMLLFSTLRVIAESVAGKSVMVVDEAIFTGATLKVVSQLLRNAGARRVYVAIPSPEVRFSCNYNMLPKRALLSNHVREVNLASYFDVQGVFFQEEVSFSQLIDHEGPQCVACFIQRDINGRR